MLKGVVTAQAATALGIRFIGTARAVTEPD